MVLPRNGFVQPVEMVAGGPLPRNGFVQPVEVIGGAPSSATPVAGGSGQFYASITAALAGEVQTVVSGLVPQAGTQAGVIVGPGTLSPVDNFYKDMFVLNTSLSPSNGLVSRWARVSSYVGATRTFTIDKPWDFSAEASFEVIDPVRIMLFLDIQEDVTFNKNFVIDLGGNRLQGKFDISSADFGWIRGSSGFVTNGIQKTDFGLLKIDDCTISQRDTTIYALLMTNGSNLGRCETSNCRFAGRISARRGFMGWEISECLNDDPTDGVGGLGYTLFESVAGVAVVVSKVDVSVTGQFDGAIFYSENSITGPSAFMRVEMDISPNLSFAAPISTFGEASTRLRSFSVIKATGAATLTLTQTSGSEIRISSRIASSNNVAAVTSFQTLAFCIARNFTGTMSFTHADSTRIATENYNFASIVMTEGTDTTGSISILGAFNFLVFGPGENFVIVYLNARLTGSVTVSTGVSVREWNSFIGVQFAATQNSGAPSITIDATSTGIRIDRWFFAKFSPGVLLTVGTWTHSGSAGMSGIHSQQALINIPSGVSAGSFVLSGAMDFSYAVSSSFANGPGLFSHSGTGGTVTVSPTNIFIGKMEEESILLLSVTDAGTIICSSAIVVANSAFGGFGATVRRLVQASAATSTAQFTGTISFFACRFNYAIEILRADLAGGVVQGPSSVIFEECVLTTTVTDATGLGTITWAGATWKFKSCHVEGLWSFSGSRFTTVESYHTRFNGNSSNKSITATGSRPTTYRYWKCSFAARYDDLQPESLDVYDILPAQAALVQGQPVKVNAANQYQVCVAASVVDGAALAAAGGAGTILIAVRQGRIFVKVNAAVANGDNLVLDTATPTQAVTAAAVVVGQGIGTALEAAGATVAGLAYTAVNVR